MKYLLCSLVCAVGIIVALPLVLIAGYAIVALIMPMFGIS
jgi:hypothetical protein